MIFSSIRGDFAQDKSVLLNRSFRSFAMFEKVSFGAELYLNDRFANCYSLRHIGSRNRPIYQIFQGVFHSQNLDFIAVFAAVIVMLASVVAH